MNHEELKELSGANPEPHSAIVKTQIGGKANWKARTIRRLLGGEKTGQLRSLLTNNPLPSTSPTYTHLNQFLQSQLINQLT
jgi:hypothetical protein